MPIHRFITTWIKYEYPELYKIIESTGLLNMLGFRYGSVTFLCPDDSTTKKITKFYNDGDIEQLETYLKALVIRSETPFGKDFEFACNAIGKELKIKEMKDDSVTLENGSKITRCDKFNTDNSKIFVWNIKGDPQIDGEQKQDAIRSRGGSKQSELFRLSLFKDANKMYNSGQKNIYMNRVLTILQYTESNDEPLFKKLIPIMDRVPFISFYLFIEPYKFNEHYIPNNTLESIFSSPDRIIPLDHEYIKYKAYMNRVYSHPIDGKNSLAVSDQVKIKKEISEIRRVIRSSSNNMNSVYSQIESAYKQLDVNSIGSAKPIYSYIPNSTQKRWQDELRFLLTGLLIEMIKDPVKSDITFNYIVSFLELRQGNNYALELSFTKKKHDAECDANKKTNVRRLNALSFVTSTDFMYFIMTDEFLETIRKYAPKNIHTYDYDTDVDSFINNEIAKETITKKLMI